MPISKLALILANARRIIKRKSAMKNVSLVMELLGCGSTAAYAHCRELGLEPDSNLTCYTTMMSHLQQVDSQQQQAKLS